MNPTRRPRLAPIAGIVLAVLWSTPAWPQLQGIEAPPGFSVQLIADNDLAPNCFSLTADSLGRPTAAGPGYVHILIDDDGDGRMDRATLFSSLPGNGAQGLHWIGRDLYCVGDQGLLRLEDANADDRADGPPQVLLKISTGGEHDAHALRRGPDGWWYLISGNMAQLHGDHQLSAASPVSHPRQGVLWRISPDFSDVHAWTHGFRNAYDFDFTPEGEAFVFDSDGERDVTLPWYRPTRVFQSLAGAHAGWVSRSWKHDGLHPDMPPILSEHGRGSPTGVVCYRHSAFPQRYLGALFVLDWTFGRVMAVPRERSGSVFSGKPEVFLRGAGAHGLAPTDIAVAPDGALWISVGGRGARGGVYRVAYEPDVAAVHDRTGHPQPARPADPANQPRPADQTSPDPLDQCLDAEQPLDSWSDRVWRPLAQRLGREKFEQAIVDVQRTTPQRVRAIEIVTEMFEGMSTSTLRRLVDDPAPLVRARAAWSLGVVWSSDDQPRELLWRWAQDDDPLVRRRAWESLGRIEAAAPTLETARRGLNDEDRWARTAAARCIARRAPQLCEALARPDQPIRVRLTAAWAWSLSQAGPSLPHAPSIATVVDVMGDLGHDDDSCDAAARIMACVWGDAGPGPELPPVFDGYRINGQHWRAWQGSDVLERLREAIQGKLASDDVDAAGEWSQVAAMLELDDPKIMQAMLDRVEQAEHPSQMLHALIVIARLNSVITDDQRPTLADALVGLPERVTAAELKVDLHWEPRLQELFAALMAKDPLLTATMIANPRFGQANHAVWARGMSGGDLGEARRRIADSVRVDPSGCTPDVVGLLGEDPQFRPLIRILAQDPALQPAAIGVLAKSAGAEDRSWYVRGLASGSREVVKASLQALRMLEATEDAQEQVELFLCARRHGGEAQDRELSERALRLLRRNLNPPSQVLPSLEQSPQWDALQTWLGMRYPQQGQRLASKDAGVEQLLASVPWDAGRPDAGQQVYRRLTCAQCHEGNTAMGPDLAGAGRRFSREDLLVAIVQPNRDVPARYQTTIVQTVDGLFHSGLVLYQSVDGVTLRTGDLRTVRIEADQIELQQIAARSLMPEGLLAAVAPQEIADLLAYLQSL